MNYKDWTINGLPVSVGYEIDFDKHFNYHFCRFKHIWKILPDEKGKTVKVDILSIVGKDDLYDIQAEIEGSLN